MATILRIKDKDGNIITVPAIKGDKGDPFKFEDFTPEQLLSITGDDGVTFTPNISSDGTLTWTNDGGLPNPPAMNIRGDNGASAYDQARLGGYKGTQTEFYLALANINTQLDGANSVIHVGNDEPTEEKYKFWIDTYASPALWKYKDADGVWQVIAGGGGGGGTGSSSTYEFTVTPDWHSKVIAYGNQCILNIEWSSKDNGNPTGNGSIRIYQYVSETESVLKDTYTIRQGTVPVDLTNYLSLGDNNFMIEIVDRSGSPSRLYPTVNTRSYSLDKDTFDTSTPYSGPVTFYFVPRGVGKKIVHIIIDGQEADTLEVTTDGILCEYSFEVNTHGRHKILAYFTCQIEGTEDVITVEPVYYEFAYIISGETAPIITTNCNVSEMKQFESVPIDIRVFTPKADGTVETLTPSLSVYESSKDTVGETDTPKSTYTDILSNQSVSYSFKAQYTGTTYVLLKAGDTVLPIPIDIEENTVNVEAVSGTPLVLYLTSKNRNNSEGVGKVEKWSYGDIECELTGFNFTPGSTNDGWVYDKTGKNTVLRAKGDARVFIPIDIFTDEVKQFGRTIEVEFSTSDVLDYDDVIMSCVDPSGKGFKFTPREAVLRSLSNEISARYKDEEQMRLSFVIQPASTTTKLMSIYINGVHSGTVQYDGTDSFTQSFPAGVRPGITIGSNLCTTDIYCIRVYKTALTSRNIVSNWIADTQDIEELLIRYKRNDIYDDNQIVSKDKLPKILPYMIVNATEDGGSNQLPQTKKDKRPFSGQFVDPLYKERCFTFTNAIWRVQGTSSEGYYRKNYDMDISKNGIILNGQLSYVFQLNDKALPTDYFCFKADVASSEGANNVELVRLFNDICPVKIPPQLADERVRQGIDGFPMVMFRYDGTNYHFLGKYNFNNSKSTPEVFGMESGVESWEITNNGSLKVIFKEVGFGEGSNWEEDFESRYPDDYKDYTRLKELSEWIKSTDRDDATGDTIPSVTYGGVPYTEDTPEYRLAKFKHECHRFFVPEHLQFFWLFTEFFLMIDNRAKNTFPTRYLDGKWYMLPYDYDTALGINNVGALTFGFSIEDIDYDMVWDEVSQTYVKEYKFNGAESVLWCNVRDAFEEEILEMYCELRRNKTLDYADVKARFDNHQTVWGESIFNEDAQVKYIDAILQGRDPAEYLPKLQGDKKSQRDDWLFNRFKYYDSKATTDDVRSEQNIINLRTNVPHPITIIPYCDMYAAILYDKTNLAKDRAYKGQSCELPFLKSNPEDCVTWILSASDIAEIEGLPYVGLSSCNIAPATKLRSIVIGSDAENTLLKSFTCGNNILLTKIDLRNCSGLTTTLRATGCTNIEEVYLEGTRVKACSLPIGGNCRTLHLPGTVNNLTLINHKISDFQLPMNNYSEKYGRYYGNLLTLSLQFSEFDNTMRDTLNVKELVTSLVDNAEALGTKASLRLQNFKIDGDDAFETIDDVLAFYKRITDNCRGVTFPTINSDGDYDTKEQSTIELIGSIKVNEDAVSGTKLAECKAIFPNVTILYNMIEATVSFYADEEKTRLIHRDTKTGSKGTTLTFDNAARLYGAPTKFADGSTEDDNTRYVYTGWKVVEGDTSQLVVYDDYIGGITENTVFVAQYREDTKYYRTFIDCADKDSQIIPVNGKETNVYYAIDGEDEVVEPKISTSTAIYDKVISGVHYNFYFTGWIDENNFSTGTVLQVPNIVDGVDTHITYEAMYEARRLYNVTFKAINPATNDYDTLKTDEYESGKSIVRPTDNPDPYYTATHNYTFSHWVDAEGNAIDWNTLKMGSSDKVVYAMYTEAETSYTVRFIVDGSVKQTVSGKPYNENYGTSLYTGPTSWSTETPTQKSMSLLSWYVSYKYEGGKYYLDYTAKLKVTEYAKLSKNYDVAGTFNEGSISSIFDNSPSSRYGMNINVNFSGQGSDITDLHSYVYLNADFTSLTPSSTITNITLKSSIYKDGHRGEILGVTHYYPCRFTHMFYNYYQKTTQNEDGTVTTTDKRDRISSGDWLVKDPRKEGTRGDVPFSHDSSRFSDTVRWLNSNLSKILSGSHRLLAVVKGSCVYVYEVDVILEYTT